MYRIYGLYDIYWLFGLCHFVPSRPLSEYVFNCLQIIWIRSLDPFFLYLRNLLFLDISIFSFLITRLFCIIFFRSVTPFLIFGSLFYIPDSKGPSFYLLFLLYSLQALLIYMRLDKRRVKGIIDLFDNVIGNASKDKESFGPQGRQAKRPTQQDNIFFFVIIYRLSAPCL